MTHANRIVLTFDTAASRICPAALYARTSVTLQVVQFQAKGNTGNLASLRINVKVKIRGRGSEVY